MDEKNTNSNQTPAPFEEKPPKKPKKKVFLSKRAVSAIYFGIAFCMVTVLTISLVSTNNEVKEGIDDLNDISISMPDISITVPDIKDPPVNEKPTGQETPGVTDEVVKPDPTPIISYIKPIGGEIIKGYHMETLVFSDTMQDFRTHNGVDIAATLGEKVLCYTDGKVSKITDDPFMGTSVEITHDAGIVSVYRNLAKEVLVEVGAELKAGDSIGTVGETALLEIADKPHLHFELWMNGECINAETEISTLK